MRRKAERKRWEEVTIATALLLGTSLQQTGGRGSAWFYRAVEFDDIPKGHFQTQPPCWVGSWPDKAGAANAFLYRRNLMVLHGTGELFQFPPLKEDKTT